MAQPNNFKKKEKKKGSDKNWEFTEFNISSSSNKSIERAEILWIHCISEVYIFQRSILLTLTLQRQAVQWRPHSFTVVETEAPMISQGFKEVDAKSEFKYVNLDLVKLVFHAGFSHLSCRER